MTTPKKVWIVVNDSLDPRHKSIAAVARTKKRALELCEDPGDAVIGPFNAGPTCRRVPSESGTGPGGNSHG